MCCPTLNSAVMSPPNALPAPARIPQNPAPKYDQPAHTAAGWYCLRTRQFSRQKSQFLTTSPTFAGPAPANVAVAESSSTSVTVASPTLSSTDLITLPVAGSFTTRTWRVTVSLSPTFTPAFLPTLIMSVFPVASATSPEITSVRVGIFSASSSSLLPTSSTALCVASPRMVFAKLLLPMSKPPPPPPDHPPPPPNRAVLERVDSPKPCTEARISPVETLITRAVIPTTALALLVPTPPMPKRPRPYPPPPTLVCWSSRPNCVIEPMTMASTPSTLPIFAAVLESARSLFEKFCSARILSSAERSISRYLPSFSSLSTSMSEMPLPMSWSEPKMAAT